jgi:hypothetical protein
VRQTIAHLMTAPNVTITPEANVVTAARRMTERQVKNLVVTGPRERLEGVVSLGDVPAAFARPDAQTAGKVGRGVGVADGFRGEPLPAAGRPVRPRRLRRGRARPACGRQGGRNER